MNMERFLDDWRQRRLVTIGLAGLCGVLGLSVAGLSWSLMTKERVTILVPPLLEADAEVRRDAASPDYLRAWGLYIAQSIGNVTPKSVEFVRQSIEPLLSSSIYADVIERIEQEVSKIKTDRLSISFEPHSVLIEPERSRVFVTGLRVAEDLVGGQERRSVTYEIGITMAAYRPLITDISTYPGKPHTANWLKQQEALGNGG